MLSSTPLPLYIMLQRKINSMRSNPRHRDGDISMSAAFALCKLKAYPDGFTEAMAIRSK
jgi:AsmA protein